MVAQQVSEREALRSLTPAQRRQFLSLFGNRWQDELDAAHGQCELRDRSLSQIVADSLQRFNGERYELTDFVIMPNHVHILAAFPDESTMLDQCESWKHFTARQINRRIGRSGRYWQADAFDHLVRGERQFQSLRRYIADNPRKAGLSDGESIHYCRALLDENSSRRSVTST